MTLTSSADTSTTTPALVATTTSPASTAASDFAFLLATPVILGAGLLKIPDLFNPEISHILGPVIVGSIIAALGTYISVKVLVKWFKHHTLYPFAIYCLIIGIISMVKFL